MKTDRTLFSRFFKVFRYVLIAALPVLLQCDGCSCSGMVETEEYWGAMTFLGDEVHYAIVKHYKKYTTGTSPNSYNGETLEEKDYVYIKNARTGEEKQIFETGEGINDFFPLLQDTVLCFTTGHSQRPGYAYKYTGERVATFTGTGIIGGWTVPYSKYLTRETGRELIEKDWAADTSVVIGESDYCNAQPWGIINGDGGAFMIKNGVKTEYTHVLPRGHGDRWINESQIIRITGIEQMDRVWVVRYDFSTEILDTLYDLEHSNVWVAVNSNATILIKDKTEIIDLTVEGYKK